MLTALKSAQKIIKSARKSLCQGSSHSTALARSRDGGCATDRPDGLPESPPIWLLNPIRT